MDYANLLNQLRQGMSEAFEELYRLHFSKIHAYITRNSGTTADARDIFQEALIVLVLRTRTNDFKLTSDPGTFLYSTAANKWLSHLKKKKITVSTDEKEQVLADLSNKNEIEEKKIYDKKAQLAYKIFKEIGENCRQLLEYIFFEKLSHAEIAEKMGYTKDSVRVTRFRCLTAFRKKMGNDPEFNQLFD